MTGVREQLPPEFVARAAEFADPDEHEAFLRSFDQPRTRGVRANPMKLSALELAERLGVSTTPVPWCPDGLVLDDGASLGGHPAHLAGLCYFQEPSAMAVVEALDPAPGWRVADLAAAPGGKTTQLAAAVGPEGLVVANDVSRKRLRALHDNLDLWGGANVVTTSRSLTELAAAAVSASGGDGSGRDGFDGVVLDAPCSGEALFRRDPAAIRHWSPAAVEGSAARQAELLVAAAALVRPDGVLVYSTCSFSQAENEERVTAFLAGHPGWTLEDCARRLGVDGGVPRSAYATELTARLWPHKGAGEGQFVARFRRDGAAPVDRPPASAAAGRRRRPSSTTRNGRRGASGRSGPSQREVLAGWDGFRRANLWTFHPSLDGLTVVGDRLFARPRAGSPLPGVDTVRPGLPLGRLKPGRFAPDPALATSLAADDAVRVDRWSLDDPRLDAFARGESLPDDGPDGWVLVAYERWGLTWGYRTGGTLKNHVPPHLRRQAAAHSRRVSPPR
ncbi:MAG: RsmB/NOP family class I SAM-dependent RNA methyltransferase [Actinomycetota bacterium]